MVTPIPIPARCPAALNHRAGYISASGRDTPSSRSVAASAANGQASHCGAFDGDMSIRQPTGWFANQRHQRVSSFLCGRVGTWVAGAA